MSKALISSFLALSLAFAPGLAAAKDKKQEETAPARVYAPVNYNLNEDLDNILLLDL